MEKAIKWVDARKRHPKKGKTVLALVRGEEKDKECSYYYYLCYFEKGAYWHKTQFSSNGKDNTLMNEVSVKLRVDGVDAWLDPSSVCHLADSLLDEIRKRG